MRSSIKVAALAGILGFATVAPARAEFLAVSFVSTVGTFAAEGFVQYRSGLSDGTYSLDAGQYNQDPTLGYAFFNANQFPGSMDSRRQPYVYFEGMVLSFTLQNGIVTGIFGGNTFILDGGNALTYVQTSFNGTTFTYNYLNSPAAPYLPFPYSSGNIVFGPQTAAIPEPGTYALLLAGLLAGVFIARWRGA